MTREEAILHMILRREELKHSVSDLDEDIKAFDMAIEALEQTRWIPVSERLPEEGEDVLVYIERNAWDEDGFQFKKKCIDIGWHIDGRWHCDGCNGVVGIAWMPLPKPYEPQESEVQDADND